MAKKKQKREKNRLSTSQVFRLVLKWMIDLLIIAAAAALYALGLNMFINPNHIAPGGVTGIAIIVASFAPIHVGALFAMINIPLVFAGFFLLNKRIMVRTLISVVLITFMTDYLFVDIPPYLATDGNGILAAIFGGLLMGVGVGMNYARESTTGGTDIVSKIINRFNPQMKLGQIQLAADGIVVLVSLIVYRDLNVVMYALISIFVQARVVDMLVYGGQECKFMMIFSERYHEISEKLLLGNYGVTLLKGEGAYSGRESNVIAIAVHKGDYFKVRRTIKETDPRAFVVITSASEVLGEGFQKLE